uniref:Integrase, catalytic region n=1 Tax=Solibacter usitatus (strain Ellin6076) TaxID=234267 RepID=Q01QE8_SOLUE
MPWQEIRVEEQRLLMIRDHEEGMSISELAEVYGVSRKTVYKWLERHDEQGFLGLQAQSRRPHRSPNQVTPEVEGAIIAARHKWGWGPGKLRVKLFQQDSRVPWPAVSTIAAVLKANGLVVSRRNRPRVPIQRPPYLAADGPNAVWNIDYKGWFRCGDGTRVDPLTISDGFSRYLLRCQHVEQTGYELTRAVFVATFQEFGLPGAIHSDNGTPFASVAPGGLSRLSIWFVKLGIVVERSRPACPQDNGRHERMHRTLKAATAKPPQATVRLQQQAFHAFQREYNEERPHEALDNKTPHSCYQASARCYPRRVPELEYGDDMETRVISQQGSLKWKGVRTFISEVFAYETLGIKVIDERWVELYFGPIRLGWLDGYRQTFSRRKPKALIAEEISVIV